MRYQFFISKSNDDEEDGQHRKSHELDGFAAECVHGKNGDPISRDGASTDKDEIADSRVIKDLVDVCTLSVAYGTQDS